MTWKIVYLKWRYTRKSNAGRHKIKQNAKIFPFSIIKWSIGFSCLTMPCIIWKSSHQSWSVRELMMILFVWGIIFNKFTLVWKFPTSKAEVGSLRTILCLSTKTNIIWRCLWRAFLSIRFSANWMSCQNLSRLLSTNR